MSKAPEDRALGTCRHEGMPMDAKKRRRGSPEMDLIDLSADPSSCKYTFEEPPVPALFEIFDFSTFSTH